MQLFFFVSVFNPFSSLKSAINGFKNNKLQKFSFRKGELTRHLAEYSYRKSTIDPLALGILDGLRPSFLVGIPEIGCPVLDPLNVEYLEADIKDFVVT